MPHTGCQARSQDTHTLGLPDQGAGATRHPCRHEIIHPQLPGCRTRASGDRCAYHRSASALRIGPSLRRLRVQPLDVGHASSEASRAIHRVRAIPDSISDRIRGRGQRTANPCIAGSLPEPSRPLLFCVRHSGRNGSTPGTRGTGIPRRRVWRALESVRPGSVCFFSRALRDEFADAVWFGHHRGRHRHASRSTGSAAPWTPRQRSNDSWSKV